MKFLNFLVILIISSFTNNFPQATDTLLSKDQAIIILMNKIENDSVYSAWTKIECLQFFTDEIDEKFFIVTVRENHNEDCPGSPLTSPRVDSFKILRDSKKILWYNLPDDKFEDYNNFLNIRHK